MTSSCMINFSAKVGPLFHADPVCFEILATFSSNSLATIGSSTFSIILISFLITSTLSTTIISSLGFSISLGCPHAKVELLTGTTLGFSSSVKELLGVTTGVLTGLSDADLVGPLPLLLDDLPIAPSPRPPVEPLPGGKLLPLPLLEEIRSDDDGALGTAATFFLPVLCQSSGAGASSNNKRKKY